MARTNYHVVPSQTMWVVKKQGSDTVLGSSLLKDDAIKKGVAIAIDNKPSSLKIHRQDGTIEDERTYGDDPFPPRG